MEIQTFSLINVAQNNGDTVGGYWIQDKTGTLNEALILAREIELANSNRITVAVTEKVNSSTPMLNYWKGLKIYT